MLSKQVEEKGCVINIHIIVIHALHVIFFLLFNNNIVLRIIKNCKPNLKIFQMYIFSDQTK